ncbi:N-acyl homoserine lactonase family protein [Acidocella sp.]|uniref:N-acyl homoserine lactonase family protein n=1 Tax=Acidocella sp. TaxID=50710 RepID=UPI00261938AE|nr:N-acyl homoserine lactonase family protein [Acidocella sp.]
MTDYSIWVLEYSQITQMPRSAVVYGAHNKGTSKLPYCYVLLKGKGRTILLDVGYNNVDYGAYFHTAFGSSNWHGPDEVLGECGIRPEDVTDCIITHAHFDHMGGIALFPNATFYVQEKEITTWVSYMALPRQFRWLMGATDPGDIMRAVDLAKQGRLVLVKGPMEDVFPGIDLHPAYETHTPASQYIVIRNDGKRQSADAWVFAGDLVYQFENLDGGTPDDPYYVPVGLAAGSQANLVFTTHEMLGRVGHESRRVIPIHEEGLKDRFPSRQTKHDLRITEIALADGEKSLVK